MATDVTLYSMYIMTDGGREGQENIWLEVIVGRSLVLISRTLMGVPDVCVDYPVERSRLVGKIQGHFLLKPGRVLSR